MAKVLKMSLPHIMEFVEFNVFNQDYSILFDDETPINKKSS